MIKILLRLSLLFSSIAQLNSSALVVKKKGSLHYIRRAGWFGTEKTKIVPIENDLHESTGSLKDETVSISVSESVVPSHSFKISEKKPNYFELLPDVVVQGIFEHLLTDYEPLREVCKDFRIIFDDLIYRISWTNFPGFTRDSLSRWKSDPLPDAVYLKYQLIPLVHVLYFNIRPFTVLSRFNSRYRNILSNSQTSQTNSDIRNIAIQLIKFLRLLKLDECLKLTNWLLKLEIIGWHDIYILLFLGNLNAAMTAWSLGLTTIAREMAEHDWGAFSLSIEYGNRGFLTVLRKKHYNLFRFMISKMQGHTINKDYFNIIIEEIIDNELWDLLNLVYSFDKLHDYSDHLVTLAKRGNYLGLRSLREYAINNYNGLAYHAASEGHLDFLKEIDAMGLLKASSIYKGNGYTAIQVAASHGQTGCLEFLLERLGIKYLGHEDDNGFMPIHLAAYSSNSDTLSLIIKLHPHYKTSRFINFKTTSPLHLAISNGQLSNAKLLLAHFPELINFKDAHKNTAIHLAVTKSNDEMLEMLLEFASPEIICARNHRDETALHLAARTSYVSRIELLMRTGHFTAMERNNHGRTPVSLFNPYNVFTPWIEIMEVFHLKSEEQVYEAYEVRPKKRFLLGYSKYK